VSADYRRTPDTFKIRSRHVQLRAWRKLVRKVLNSRRIFSENSKSKRRAEKSGRFEFDDFWNANRLLHFIEQVMHRTLIAEINVKAAIVR
jgi:hypothetical protein